MAEKEQGADGQKTPKGELARRDLLKMGFSSAMANVLLVSAKTMGLTGLAVTVKGCGGSDGGGGDNNNQTDTTESTVVVSGGVFDSLGSPVSGATVTISSDPVTTTTDANGLFSVEVETGAHTIMVTIDTTTLYQGTFTVTQSTPVDLGDIYPTAPYRDGSSFQEAAIIASGTTINFSDIPASSARYCRFDAAADDLLTIDTNICGDDISIHITDDQESILDTYYPSPDVDQQYFFFVAGTYYLEIANSGYSQSYIDLSFEVESDATYTDTYSDSYSDYSDSYSDYSDSYSNYSNTYSNYSNYSDSYFNYSNNYYNYFVNSW